MVTSRLYLPQYTNSWALVIGIDKYAHVSPLLHACNDAKAVSEVLTDQFAFPKENVELLLNENATRDRIIKAYLKFADEATVDDDDRIFLFFAGHGHTAVGRRGEIGYLVPADGGPDDLSTLIRWDDLTRNADLIPAKHMLFLMDACYGGLALNRKTSSGRTRFLKDMLQRYARQVLTAGKADEEVSDGGGTRPGHSIFTSHLLDGMEGAAASSEGVITGYGLMAYTYNKVGNDRNSHQTPHFGFFDGDGDFIFDTSVLKKLSPKPTSEPDPELDLPLRTPAMDASVLDDGDNMSDQLKGLISNPSEKIRLNDLISNLIRQTTAELGPDKFSPNGLVTREEFAARLQRYEVAILDLENAVILLAHWAEPSQVRLLERVFSRLGEAERPAGGTVVWLRLAWYPITLLMYAAGISALAAGRFDTLRAALLAPIYPGIFRSNEGNLPIIIPAVDELMDAADAFKQLPDMERKYVPRSEHIFKKIQPVVEDQLLLGRTYETLFDQFEIMLALVYGDLRHETPQQHFWGPPGRFAWKERGRGGGGAPFTKFTNDAKAKGQNWEALKEGFFRGSAQRFADDADAYAELLSQIQWW
jgi:hypothetical protein